MPTDENHDAANTVFTKTAQALHHHHGHHHHGVLDTILADARKVGKSVERSELLTTLMESVGTILVDAVEKGVPEFKPVIDLVERLIHMTPEQRKDFIRHDRGEFHKDLANGAIVASSHALHKLEQLESS